MSLPRRGGNTTEAPDATLVLILVSARLDRVKESWASVRDQSDCVRPHEAKIVINSTDRVFVSECSTWCRENSIPFCVTESNGSPGKGHNACIRVFREEEPSTFGWCVMLDGDDVLIPGGLAVLEECWSRSDRADVLLLSGNDVVGDKSDQGIRLDGAVYLGACMSGCDAPFRWITGDRATGTPPHPAGNPFLCKRGADFATPMRIMALTRKAVTAGGSEKTCDGTREPFPIAFCEETKLFDDIVAFAGVMENHRRGALSVAAVTAPGIMLYNSFCQDEARATERFQSEQRRDQTLEDSERKAVLGALDPLRDPLEREWGNVLETVPVISDSGSAHRPASIEVRMVVARRAAETEMRFMESEALRLLNAKEFTRASELLNRLMFIAPERMAATEHLIHLRLGILAQLDDRPWEAMMHWRRSKLIKPTAEACVRISGQLSRFGCVDLCVRECERAAVIAASSERGHPSKPKPPGKEQPPGHEQRVKNEGGGGEGDADFSMETVGGILRELRRSAAAQQHKI